MYFLFKRRTITNATQESPEFETRKSAALALLIRASDFYGSGDTFDTVVERCHQMILEAPFRDPGACVTSRDMSVTGRVPFMPISLNYLNRLVDKARCTDMYIEVYYVARITNVFAQQFELWSSRCVG